MAAAVAVACVVLIGAGCASDTNQQTDSQSAQPVTGGPVPKPMPRIVGMSLTNCGYFVGKMLTEGEIGTGCQYQDVPGLWDRSYANDSYALMARDPWRYLGLGFCRGQPVARVESSDFDCR